MTAEATNATRNWLCTGNEVFPAMLAAIDAARSSVCLETYIFAAGGLGDRFLQALVRARQRGVQVRVLIDALGSMALPANYWQPLIEAGGEARRFNPLSLHRLGIRNHRKLLVCDEQVAFIGGFNIAPEYEGDGVTCGWSDVGLKLEGPLVAELQDSFEEMFARADFQHKHFVRFRKSALKRVVRAPHEQLLLSGPGRGRNPIRAALRKDLVRARDVRITTAYFLPPWRLRRDLARLARRGRKVQLMLAGKSDVAVSRLAAQSLYRRFLRTGVQIYEYEPQVLHAKLIIIDNIVYLGSANLDQRSLSINYELMIRFESQEMAEQARAIFQANFKHCRQITPEHWRKSRSLWQRLKQRWAYLLLVRIDPYLARRQWRALPD